MVDVLYSECVLYLMRYGIPTAVTAPLIELSDLEYLWDGVKYLLFG